MLNPKPQDVTVGSCFHLVAAILHCLPGKHVCLHTPHLQQLFSLKRAGLQYLISAVHSVLLAKYVPVEELMHLTGSKTRQVMLLYL